MKSTNTDGQELTLASAGPAAVAIRQPSSLDILDAEVLFHEATFVGDGDMDPSGGHSTVRDAVRTASDAKVGALVLFHLSEGHHLPFLLTWIPGWPKFVVFDCGQLGVPVFFVLSGFVMAHMSEDIMAKTTKDDKGRATLPNGNIVVPTGRKRQ